MAPPVPLAAILQRLCADEARVVADDDSDWKHAAVAAIFRDGPEGAELLFIQRAEHQDDPWSGQVGFPGGRSEQSDASLEHTAARETSEEVGLELLDAPDVRRLGPLDQLQARARRRILPMAITPFAFVHDGPERPTLQPNEEVESAFWIPVGRLADPEHRVWYEHPMAEVDYLFPAIDLGQPGTPLWGLTHYMTMEILLRLGLVDDVGSLTMPKSIDG